MTGKNLVKAIVLGTALLTGASAFAQSKPDVIATFEYTSHRPEKEYNGKTYKYNILSDGTICQADKPDVKFARTWFYDVDGDGEFTATDLAAHKEGKLIYMHPEFNKIADAESKRILENLVVSLNFDRLNKPTTDDHTNPFTGAEGDYNGDGKTDSKEVGGYPYNERIAQKNDYEPILDEPTLPKEKVNPVWSLIAGANVNSALDKYGLSVGARVNPFRNKKIGLGLTADLGFGKDKKVDSNYFKFSEGEEYFGEINEIDNRSFGFSTELQLYNFIVGAGLDYSKHLSETNEKLIRGKEVLDSSVNSVSEGKVYGKGYVGVEFQPTKKWGVGATIGYHGKDGLQFGLRNTIKWGK